MASCDTCWHSYPDDMVGTVNARFGVACSRCGMTAMAHDEYCIDDVTLERDLSNFIDKYGYVLHNNFGIQKVEPWS